MRFFFLFANLVNVTVRTLIPSQCQSVFSVTIKELSAKVISGRVAYGMPKSKIGTLYSYFIWTEKALHCIVERFLFTNFLSVSELKSTGSLLHWGQDWVSPIVNIYNNIVLGLLAVFSYQTKLTNELQLVWMGFFFPLCNVV